jgi:hypothetical protein
MIPFLLLLAQSHWWGVRVEASLDRSPDRKAKWVSYLQTVEPQLRPAIGYLVADLPFGDLRSLDPAKLTTNVRLALKAKQEVPWGKTLPDDIFNDAVLPHVCLSEPRDSMRAEFHDRYLPISRAAHSPGEAALALNKTLFKDYKVIYNTKRLRTDQSPKETIAQGMATCTGLSIMLVDACRAIGIPARIAGIHSWPGRGGNHTWVEVWDGSWHFVGAAEPDPKGLDNAWFATDASKAVKSQPMNAIYAVTYRETGDHFPAAWDDDATFNAVNVTDRYSEPAAASSVRLMIDVTFNGQRVNADADVSDPATGNHVGAGVCLGPTADTNRFFTLALSAGQTVMVKVTYHGHTATKIALVNEDTVLRFDLSH